MGFQTFYFSLSCTLVGVKPVLVHALLKHKNTAFLRPQEGVFADIICPPIDRFHRLLNRFDWRAHLASQCASTTTTEEDAMIDAARQVTRAVPGMMMGSICWSSPCTSARRARLKTAQRYNRPGWRLSVERMLAKYRLPIEREDGHCF